MCVFSLRWSPGGRTPQNSSLLWWRTWPVRTSRGEWYTEEQQETGSRSELTGCQLFWLLLTLILCWYEMVMWFCSLSHPVRSSAESQTCINPQIRALFTPLWVCVLWEFTVTCVFLSQVKKLVYVYLVRYAEEQQDLALLSISTFQRGLKVLKHTQTHYSGSLHAASTWQNLFILSDRFHNIQNIRKGCTPVCILCIKSA